MTKYCESCGVEVAASVTRCATCAAVVAEPATQLAQPRGASGVVDGIRVNVETMGSHLQLTGENYDRSYRYKVLTYAWIEATADSAALVLNGTDFSVRVESIEGVDPNVLCDEIRNGIALELGRKAQSMATPTSAAPNLTSRDSASAARQVVRTRQYEFLALLASVLKVLGWIAIVFGTLGVLAFTFQSNSSDGFFVVEISAGERMLRFILGVVAVAFAATPLLALGHMIEPILDTNQRIRAGLGQADRQS